MFWKIPFTFVDSIGSCNRQTYFTTPSYTGGMFWHTKVVAKTYPVYFGYDFRMPTHTTSIVWLRFSFANHTEVESCFNVQFGCYTVKGWMHEGSKWDKSLMREVWSCSRGWYHRSIHWHPLLKPNSCLWYPTTFIFLIICPVRHDFLHLAATCVSFPFLFIQLLISRKRLQNFSQKNTLEVFLNEERHIGPMFKIFSGRIGRKDFSCERHDFLAPTDIGSSQARGFLKWSIPHWHSPMWSFDGC